MNTSGNKRRHCLYINKFTSLTLDVLVHMFFLASVPG